MIASTYELNQCKGDEFTFNVHQYHYKYLYWHYVMKCPYKNKGRNKFYGICHVKVVAKGAQNWLKPVPFKPKSRQLYQSPCTFKPVPIKPIFKTVLLSTQYYNRTSQRRHSDSSVPLKFTFSTVLQENEFNQTKP